MLIHNIPFETKRYHNLVKFQKSLSKGMLKTVGGLFQFIYHMFLAFYLKNLRKINFLKKLPVKE